MIFGSNINAADLTELVERGADRVLAVEAKELEHFLVEPYARCMLSVRATVVPLSCTWAKVSSPSHCSGAPK